MRGLKKLLPVFLIFISLLIVSDNSKSIAADSKQLPSVTVINLLRGKYLGHEKDNLFESLKDQWSVTKQQKINATWLWQYSSLEDSNMTSFAKSDMKTEEFGLLLEIDSNYAGKANVGYRGRGPSYFSDGLLLVSYDVNERHKLIDTAFRKFKEAFGYYPKTVGAWWIGADSLVYMQEKYKITSALKASEQFDLDVYSIWGTPFSIPYIASKENEGIPADNYADSSKVVILQWAARDPLKGYYDATYSIQDYFLHGYDKSYVPFVAETYLKTPNSNLVFGLENGGNLKNFKDFYNTSLTLVNQLASTNKAKIVKAEDFAKNFLDSKEVFSGNNYFLYKDFKSNDQSFWINLPKYRANIQKAENNIYLTDVRDYSNKYPEDFNFLPNSQGVLRINEKSLIDEMRLPNSKKLITASTEQLNIKKNKSSIDLYVGEKKIANFSPDSFKISSGKNINYNFSNPDIQINLTSIIIALYFVYFFSIYLYKKSKLELVMPVFISLLILWAAHPYLAEGLQNNLTFVFDKKFFAIINFLPISNFTSVSDYLIILQVLPFILLITIHFIFSVVLRRKKIFFIISLALFYLYAHVPYFPIDRSTFINIAFIAGVLFTLSLFWGFVIYFGTRSKRSLGIYALTVFIFFILFASISFLSRTKFAITSYETQALQIIKDKHKDVLFVTQLGKTEPIYKAAKPIINSYPYFAQKLTNTKWQIEERPENFVLQTQNYKDKLFFVPRYLGADLSVYEQKKLGLKKIFDNAQIALFEPE